MGLMKGDIRTARGRASFAAEASPSDSTQQTSRVTPISSVELATASRALGVAGGGAAQLLRVLYDDDVSAPQILRCLRIHPALAARVLKVANSAYYRRTGTVGTLERAVPVLGLAALRGIAATGCMDRLPLPAVGQALDPQRLHRHSLAVALAAQSLSERSGAGVDAEAFMAGLLHDIGILVLAGLRPQALAAANRAPPPDPTAVLEHEIALIGADHATAGALLAQAWGLPEWLSNAMRLHQAPRSGARTSGHEALPLLLAIADRCAEDSGFGLGQPHAAPLDTMQLRALGMDEAQYTEIGAGLQAAVDALTQGVAG